MGLPLAASIGGPHPRVAAVAVSIVSPGGSEMNVVQDKTWTHSAADQPGKMYRSPQQDTGNP